LLDELLNEGQCSPLGPRPAKAPLTPRTKSPACCIVRPVVGNGAGGRMPTLQQPFTIRAADLPDIPSLAYHRAAMFRDMGTIPAHQEEPLMGATVKYLGEAMPRGEYLAWVAEDRSTPPAVIGGAGVQLRPLLPRPRSGADGLELGPEAIVLNVYVEREWRRRGVAAVLMRALLDALAARGIGRVVLHASDEGRRLYERLGFVPTNEMRLDHR
jgi:GNAT superfamily N-acetyltransferase